MSLKIKPEALICALWLSACAQPTVPLPSAEADQAGILAIFEALDDRSLTVDAQLLNYAPDAVILVPNEREIRGTDAVRQHLSEFGTAVDITTRHEIVEQKSYADVVIVQGRVVGTATPDGDPNTYPFETKNVIVFDRTEDNGLKISKVIYNAAPAPE
ncbi:MAG: nuclear transport factor 2 family protein [Litorimonas sp.]